MRCDVFANRGKSPVWFWFLIIESFCLLQSFLGLDFSESVVFFQVRNLRRTFCTFCSERLTNFFSFAKLVSWTTLFCPIWMDTVHYFWSELKIFFFILIHSELASRKSAVLNEWFKLTEPVLGFAARFSTMANWIIWFVLLFVLVSINFCEVSHIVLTVSYFLKRFRFLILWTNCRILVIIQVF